jgi:hypothetical protein
VLVSLFLAGSWVTGHQAVIDIGFEAEV